MQKGWENFSGFGFVTAGEGGWILIGVLLFILLLLCGRRLSGLGRGLRLGFGEFQNACVKVRDELDTTASDAGKSAGGIHGKPAYEALTPKNETAELYEPARVDERRLTRAMESAALGGKSKRSWFGWLGRENLVPFLIGVVAAPVCIVLHETGHWAMARMQHLPAQLHYRATTVRLVGQPPASVASSVPHLVVVTGGPVVQALLGGGGLLWLWGRRRTRRMEPATLSDWLATWGAANGGRWLAGWGSWLGKAAGTQLKDEVTLMKAWGIPVPLGSVILGTIAFAFLVVAVRLHPPGRRLVPFCFALAGGLLGLNIWMQWLGPLMLP